MKIVHALIATAAVLNCGCGTILNFATAVVPSDDGKERPAVYGGVQFDAAIFARQPFVPKDFRR